MIFTKLNYCQYLLISQINYTLTNLAEHLEQISHDKINRYLKNEKLTPRLLWDMLKISSKGVRTDYLVFVDNLMDKGF
nr:transposase [Nostoc sp. DedQUE03]